MSCCQSCNSGRPCEAQPAPPEAKASCCSSCAEGKGCEGAAEDLELLQIDQDFGDFTAWPLRPDAPLVLASALALTSAATNASQPVSLDECVAGSVLFEVLALTQDTSVELFVEGGFRQNFFRVSSTVFSEKGVWQVTFSGLATPVMRLYYVVSGNQNAGAIVDVKLCGRG